MKTKRQQKEEALKNWCKAWSVKTIVNRCFAMGTEYVAEIHTDKETEKYRGILVKEINRRIKSKK